MTSSEDEINLTPNTEMEEKAKQLVENLLPPKSRTAYLRAYQNFIKWKNEKQVDSYSESVFLNYFDELSKKYQPSSLWSTYSMLKTTMQTKHDVNIKNFVLLTTFLKRFSSGFKAKKSKVFTAKEVETFLNSAPNEKYLAIKVALIFGISGACRGIELTNITIGDVETDVTLQAINIPNTKTNKERTFVVCGEYLNIVKKYQKLRPSNVTSNRFFPNYQNGKCTKQVIGKNKFASMPKEIATYLNLPNPEQYTGHCFRRTSATLLADLGANITTLKRHGGWRSNQVAEGYIEESVQNKHDITQRITKTINILPTNEPQPSKSREPPRGLLVEPTAIEPPTVQPWKITPSPTFTEEHNPRNENSQASQSTQVQTRNDTRINLPGQTISLSITNCTNCTFNFSK